MMSSEHSDLLFNRQYVISPRELKPIDGWADNKIGSSFIYTHLNLEVTINSDEQATVALIGYMLDAENPSFSNTQILNELKKKSFEDVLFSSSRYAGRFLIVYFDEKEFKLFHDPAGLMEVFYYENNGLWVASQPSLLSKFIELDRIKTGFYTSEAFEDRKERILGTTECAGLEHLTPNHYLDLTSGKSERYFPQESIAKLPVDLAANECAKYIKGFVEAAHRRHDLLIAVTGGWDSRMMLAVSLHLTNVHYFILKHGHMQDDDLDLNTPSRLLKMLNRDFDIIEYNEQLDSQIDSILSQSVALRRAKSNAPFYHVFYKKFRNYLNVTCVSEAARNYYHYQADPNKVNGKTLAVLNKFAGIEFVETTYQKWVDENADLFRQNGYNILDMFYWEEKMGNWLANGRSAMSTVIEDFSPFNCRNLMTLFLSVDEKYRDRYNPILHKKIIRNLNRDALKVPVNGSLKYLIIKCLVILKVYPLYKRIQLALKAN